MRGSLSFFALALITLTLFLGSLALGSSPIPLSEVLSILQGQSSHYAPWSTIVLEIRLPRSLTAIVAGSGLAISGLLMQTLFRNPLAGPGVLGITSGASLGVAMIVMGGTSFPIFLNTTWGSWSMAFAAFLGSTTVLTIVILFARRVQSAISLLIIGLMMGYLSSALVQILTYFSTPETIQRFALWGMGSFGDTTWQDLALISFLGGGAFIATMALSPSLDILLLGDHYAHTMGIDVAKSRRWIILIAAILTGSITAFCGPIAFLGLAVPHLCRRLMGTSKHTVLVPACLVCGAALALASDLIARLPGSDLTLPLNTITALIGAPVVMIIVLKKQGWSY